MGFWIGVLSGVSSDFGWLHVFFAFLNGFPAGSHGFVVLAA